MTDEPLRIAILGPGRMGRAIEQVAAGRGVTVAAVLGRDDVEAGDRVGEALSAVDVALEFSAPASAVPNVRLCVQAGCPVVVGTTGWYDDLSEVTACVEGAGGALLWAPNFAFGAAVLGLLLERAGPLFARAPGFDAHITETHHAGKRDAPSGTALALQAALSGGLGRDVPTTSVRLGQVPGTHEVVLDGPFEQVVLRHAARDRRVFADGALRAAHWLVGRTGVYTLRDMIEGEAR